MSGETAESRIRSDIAKYGWHVIKVLPEGEHQPHSYSIGLFETFGHPEIAIVGLRGETAHALIGNVVDAIRTGHVFASGCDYSDIAQSFRVAFVSVPQLVNPEYFGWAIWYYKSSVFPVLQMVWLDRSGFFPWDAEFAEDLRSVQPILGG